MMVVGTNVRADIFKWVDDQGTMHFTDDPSSIPHSKRGQSSSPMIKEPPVKEATPVQAPSAAPPSNPAAPAEAVSPVTGENGTEALQRNIEQLKAKISAKESHNQSVDDKRSLATNPLRNRVVSPADLDLYQKYQSELPGDRERLRQLESELQGSR